eukprot:NODE_234_length_13549_cov_0.394349.p4 type:complete len:274 gc:universal NODE_234_length_13549_cov_0.394349:2015-2836(+)
MNVYNHAKEGENIPELNDLQDDDFELVMNADTDVKMTENNNIKDFATGEAADRRGFHPNPTVGVSDENFLQGRFPNTMSSQDFVKFTKFNDWSDQDTFKLLEGVEMYENDWDAISTHTGKDRDECILKYLDLPSGKSINESSVVGTTPDHPILALVSFLSSKVDSKTAKAAAKAAKELNDSDSQVLGSTALALVSVHAKKESEKSKDRLASLTVQYVDLLCHRVEQKLTLLDALQQQMTTERRSMMKTFTAVLKDKFMQVDNDDVDMGEAVQL